MSNRVFKETEDIAIEASITLGANGTSVPVEMAKYRWAQIQANLTYAGLDDSEGNIKLQVSADRVNWSDYPDSAQNFEATTGNLQWLIQDVNFRYIRVAVTNTTGTGGTAAILGHLIM